MALNVINTLIANITTTEDTTQNVIINRSNGNPSSDSNVAQMVEYRLMPVGTTVIQLPIATIYQIYVKNIDTAGQLIINLTLAGVAQNVAILNPGDMYIYWAKSGGSGAGATTFSVLATVSATLMEYFIGG